MPILEREEWNLEGAASIYRDRIRVLGWIGDGAETLILGGRGEVRGRRGRVARGTLNGHAAEGRFVCRDTREKGVITREEHAAGRLGERNYFHVDDFTPHLIASQYRVCPMKFDH